MNAIAQSRSQKHLHESLLGFRISLLNCIYWIFYMSQIWFTLALLNSVLDCNAVLPIRSGQSLFLISFVDTLRNSLIDFLYPSQFISLGFLYLMTVKKRRTATTEQELAHNNHSISRTK